MFLTRTWDMEHTAQFLALRHPRVLVRATYYLARAIRFRSKLVPLPMWIVREKVGQLEQWRENGGLCLWERKTFDVPEHDAQLICEAPRSLKELERQTLHTLARAVVYQPPTWEMHAYTVWTRARTPHKLRKAMKALRELVILVDGAPVFTPIVYRR